MLFGGRLSLSCTVIRGAQSGPQVVGDTAKSHETDQVSYPHHSDEKRRQAPENITGQRDWGTHGHWGGITDEPYVSDRTGAPIPSITFT